MALFYNAELHHITAILIPCPLQWWGMVSLTIQVTPVRPPPRLNINATPNIPLTIHLIDNFIDSARHLTYFPTTLSTYSCAFFFVSAT